MEEGFTVDMIADLESRFGDRLQECVDFNLKKSDARDKLVDFVNQILYEMYGEDD